MSVLEKLRRIWRKVIPAIVFEKDDINDRLGGQAADEAFDETDYEYDDADIIEEAEEAEEAEEPVRARNNRMKIPQERQPYHQGFIYTPHIKGGTLQEKEAPISIVVVNDYNLIEYVPELSLLKISEKDESGALTTVEVSLRLLDQRVTPVFSGIIDAIKDNNINSINDDGETADSAASVDGNAKTRAPLPDAPNPLIEKPYMVESGQITFLWYRQSMRLEISRDKVMDDNGLLLSSGAVTLYVGFLGRNAIPLFKKLLNERSNIIRL